MKFKHGYAQSLLGPAVFGKYEFDYWNPITPVCVVFLVYLLRNSNINASLVFVRGKF